MTNDKDFIKQFEELRSWIRNSVDVFKDDSPESKEIRLRKAEKDKIYFAKTYFPHYCEDDFADIHKEMFDLSDTYMTPVVIAGARELAKSTIISFFDEMHKTCFKKNKFTEFICDTQETAASEFLLPIRAELEENPRLLNDFGEQKTSLWKMEDFVTRSGKRFLALGPKMGAKGKKHKSSRPDRIIIEDFENQNSPKKKSILKRRLKFILSDLMKSVNSKKWQVIFIGNYFSKKTIIHILLTDDRFKHWVRKIYSALIEVNGKFKSSWESRLPLKQLLEEQKEDPITFRTERMQKPDDEEAVFKEEWFQTFEYKEIENLDLPVVTYKDPSALKGEEHCYKAIIVLAVDKSNATYYVINAWIKKASKWAGVNKHFDLSEQYKSAVDAVESNGYQATLREDYELLEAKRGKRLNLKMISNRLPKDVRVTRLSSLIERGYIKFIKNSTDQNELLDELMDFPDGEYVDGPDALAGAVEVADQYILKKKNKVSASILD